MAINAGALSPIGEPFAMFPPKVAAFLTCVEPYLVNNFAKKVLVRLPSGEAFQS
jgi:hypothetical protein